MMAPKIPQVNPSLLGGAGEAGTSGVGMASVAAAGKRLQKKSPVAETYKISNNPGTGTPPLRRSNRTKAGGGDPGEGTPRKKPRGESPRYVFRVGRLLAAAATKPPREDTSSEDRDVQSGAYTEGSGKDEAAVSAARRSYGAADNPVVSTTERARTAAVASAARRSYGAADNPVASTREGARTAAAASAARRSLRRPWRALRGARTARPTTPWR